MGGACTPVRGRLRREELRMLRMRIGGKGAGRGFSLAWRAR
jgi:hypothetical protein